jgi:AraC-like DNA-binding protein/predicted secreted protein
MRQGYHADALRQLGAADQLAASLPERSSMPHRVDAWRAELAYFQGRYSDATKLVDRLLPQLEQCEDWAYVAFVLRIRIAILLARTEYEGAVALAERAVAAAKASQDDYVLVQVLNVLGAVHFDRATSKLKAPHARAHLSLLDSSDTAPLEADARASLQFFERARTVAIRAHYTFAAWYVAGNIERLQILLGRADRAIRPIRRRLRELQARGATYDEIVTRSNLAWGLRSLGRHREALHELDVALRLARDTGTANVLLEFLEYDRSIVLDALGDAAGARASYRRYLHLVGAAPTPAPTTKPDRSAAPLQRPLEPYFLKRADRFILANAGETFSVKDLAKHCGVSWRTLEKAFCDFRSVTPVAHIRSLRLDKARDEFAAGAHTVAEVASSLSFKSTTTFALEYRKRFGISPSDSVRAVRTAGR